MTYPSTFNVRRVGIMANDSSLFVMLYTVSIELNLRRNPRRI
jgi:hypothetical protein